MAKRGSAKGRHATRARATIPLEAGPFVDPLPPGVGIEHSDKKIVISFPEVGERERDVSELLVAGSLALPMARAVARVLASAKAGNSRSTKYKDLEYGYLKFIKSLDTPPQTDADISTRHVFQFIGWLSQQPSARTGEPLSKGNRIHKLGALAAVLAKLSREFPEVDVAELVPENPWPTEIIERNTTTPLDAEVLRKLVLKVEGDLKPLLDAVGDHFPSANGMTSTAWEIRGTPTRRGKAFAKLADYIADYGYFPRMDVLRGKVLRREINEATLETLCFIAGPVTRQLFLAFEYILIFTAFNEQPLRELSLADIDIDEVMGFKRVSFASEKVRALGTVRRVFVEDPNDVLSVHRVVTSLIAWTASLRTYAPPDLRDKLFLLVPHRRDHKYRVGSFSELDKKGHSGLSNSAMTLSREIGEGYIGSRVLRATGAELLNDLVNGDLPAVALALGQATVITTNNNYRSRTVRDNDEWRLAGVMSQRERHIASKGAFDPRERGGLSAATACTPGWVCMDNLDSPIEGQRKGYPCIAYPMCPKCPLSQPHPDRARFLARNIQLFTKIQEAIEAQGPRAVLARYGDLIPYLEANRRRIDDPETIEKAANMKLSPLPDLD